MTATTPKTEPARSTGFRKIIAGDSQGMKSRRSQVLGLLIMTSVLLSGTSVPAAKQGEESGAKTESEALPGSARGEGNVGLDSLDSCNVVWDSPSTNSSGSMPLGNGDIGVNAWVEENGDLLFFISKTDAWSDCGRLLKLGQVRVRLTPSLAARPFRQELQLRQGRMVIRSGAEGSAATLRLWVDANRPVIHVECESQKVMQAQVSLHVWRMADRDLRQDRSAGNIHQSPVPIIEKADVVVPSRDNRIVWYHRNELTIFPLTMKVQGLESLMKIVPDPILHSTFGGCISGKGFVHAEAGEATQALKTAAPTRRLDVAIHVLTAQTDTPEQWVEKLDRVVAEERKTGLANAWSAHCRWWQDFWNRSWIFVRTPEDDAPATAEQIAERLRDREDLQLIGKNGLHGPTHILPAVSVEPAGRVVTRGYARQRFITAAGGRGAYPIKFDGSIFTVNSKTDSEGLQDADFRPMGPNYWFLDTATTTYGPMLRSGDYDLLRPLFAMYRAMVPMARERTRLYFQHEGIFIPATVYPWGTVPNDDYGWKHSGRPGILDNNVYVRWLWQGGVELTAKMLDYYEATQDQAFLRDTLMPIADGVTTFYDQHWKRDEKGKIRFDPACSLESCHSVVNPLPEIAGLRYVLPRLLALPGKETTAAQRAAWTKTLADLPKVPMSGEADKKILVAAEVIKDRQGDELPELYAVFPYRLYALGSRDFDIGLRSVETYAPPQPRTVYPFEGKVGGWRLNLVQVAFAGKADQAARMVVSNFASHHRGSRFPAFWGPNQVWNPDQSHGGVSMTALQAMLLQVDGRKIYLFPAWPKEWDVSFKLHAPYNTTVEGEQRDGKVTFLKVTPQSRAADVVNMLAK